MLAVLITLDRALAAMWEGREDGEAARESRIETGYHKRFNVQVHPLVQKCSVTAATSSTACRSTTRRVQLPLRHRRGVVTGAPALPVLQERSPALAGHEHQRQHHRDRVRQLLPLQGVHHRYMDQKRKYHNIISNHNPGVSTPIPLELPYSLRYWCQKHAETSEHGIQRSDPVVAGKGWGLEQGDASKMSMATRRLTGAESKPLVKPRQLVEAELTDMHREEKSDGYKQGTDKVRPIYGDGADDDEEDDMDDGGVAAEEEEDDGDWEDLEEVEIDEDGWAENDPIAEADILPDDVADERGLACLICYGQLPNEQQCGFECVRVHPCCLSCLISHILFDEVLKYRCPFDRTPKAEVSFYGHKMALNDFVAHVRAMRALWSRVIPWGPLNPCEDDRLVAMRTSMRATRALPAGVCLRCLKDISLSEYFYGFLGCVPSHRYCASCAVLMHRCPYQLTDDPNKSVPIVVVVGTRAFVVDDHHIGDVRQMITAGDVVRLADQHEPSRLERNSSLSCPIVDLLL